MKYPILLFTGLAFLFACQNNSSSEATDEAHNETSGTELIEEKLPCDLISEAEIKSICNMPDSAKATIEKKERTYTSCFYTWENYTFNRVMEMAGMNVDIPIPAEMSIVPVKNATEDMFETSTKVYKDGEVITGLGDKAIWGAQMSQLTFLAKGQMIHLHLVVSDDAASNKTMALEIAAVLVKNL